MHLNAVMYLYINSGFTMTHTLSKLCARTSKDTIVFENARCACENEYRKRILKFLYADDTPSLRIQVETYLYLYTYKMFYLYYYIISKYTYIVLTT